LAPKSVNDFNTTVTRGGDGWRLNGRKFYCTGSLAGDITFGPCRVDGSDEVRVFYTPTDGAGTFAWSSLSLLASTRIVPVAARLARGPHSGRPARNRRAFRKEWPSWNASPVPGR
jgi:alkylation response protein AidB-like acyl-CoA dehydrogenase